MLTGKQLMQLIDAGASPEVLKIVGKIVDDMDAEKVTRNDTRNQKVTTKAVYMRNYRKNKKTEENHTPQVTRNHDVTGTVTPRVTDTVCDEKDPAYIENAQAGAPAHVELLLSDKVSKKKERKRNNINNGDYSPEYVTFTEAYPRNNGTKKQGYTRYLQALAQGISHETLIDGARRYAAHCIAERKEPQYVKHAATWIYNRGWETEYLASPPGGKGESTRDAGERAIRELEESGIFGRDGQA